MIEVKALTKQFNTLTAVDALSFTAERGEVIGLLGPNGAGKTTTIRMLTTYMPPTSGTATVAGYDILEDPDEVRARVGYLPERVPIYPDMTVEGYIRFWAALRHVRKPGQRAREVIEQVHLGDRRRSLIRNLSKGMRQRLGLAQALVHNPEVIILDEPTIGIDPQQVIEVRQMVRDLRQDHTVLFSTHILSEAEQICDRVLIMRGGRIVAQGTADTLRQQLQPGAHLFLAVNGAARNAVIERLRPVKGIEKIQAQGEGVAIRIKAGVDARPEISRAITSAGWDMIELRPVAMTLEDIFLDVVNKGAER